MTRIGAMDTAALSRRLAAGAVIAVPPFAVRLQTPLAALHRSMHMLYGEFDLLDDGEAPDFVIRVAGTGGLRRFARRQAMAFIDTPPPYTPLPEFMAPIMFEQALNWCVATRTLTHLILHAAVVARNGRAVILPGQSGQGKSTLCAALVARGWRHMSDEFALLDPSSLAITAHPRPISLKNSSLAVVADFAPQLEQSQAFEGTPKGTIGYVRPARAAVEAASQAAAPVAVVFPRFDPAEAPSLDPMGKAAAFIALTACSVNYREFGHAGFDAISRLVDGHAMLGASYPDTESAVALLEQVVA
ncbi:HprK-related kinase A [Emcibacter sp. SYSU 3D8]|uniref:HprK-related kinase A n=1 Tax=Emcibacter sp. SYSU 3D8 TaxID=3133969 RepID=UPI0031FEE70F